MSCLINEIQRILNNYKVSSIDFSASFDEEGKFVLTTFRCIHDKEEDKIYLLHKPTYDELEDLFREEDK